MPEEACIVRLGRPSREPARRYERSRPGELIPIDVKKLGRIDGSGKRVMGRTPRHYRARGAGWEFVHVCVDDEKATIAIGFLRRAMRFFYRHGVVVESVLIDNGSAYRSALHALACRALGVEHLRTRPYRPQTNGKAERFIRTMLGGWAYGAIYRNSFATASAMSGTTLRTIVGAGPLTPTPAPFSIVRPAVRLAHLSQHRREGHIAWVKTPFGWTEGSQTLPNLRACRRSSQGPPATLTTWPRRSPCRIALRTRSRCRSWPVSWS